MLPKNKSPHTQNWIMDIVSIVILFSVFYALWIGAHPLFTPDEGRYSEVAREMVATGDYVTPRVNGVAFLDKPALYYWLQASAIQVFGLKEWALRFWPAVMGILGSLMTYLTGRLLFDRRTALLSATILATSPLYYGAAHYANLDLEVAVLISNALLCFISATHVSSTRFASFLFIVAYVFCGLAALTKGLIGIVFPAIIFGAWVMLLNRWYLLKKMHLFIGTFIFLSITAPWYWLAQKANPEFFHFFFVTQQVSRFLTTADFNNKTAGWFYIPIVFLGFFPWSIFLIQSIGQKIKQVWENRQQHAIELFLLLWLVFIFTFFSIPKSKTVGYILPIFPTLALLTGNYLSLLWDKANARGIRAGIVIFTLCSIAFMAFLTTTHNTFIEIPNNAMPYLICIAITFSIGSVICFLIQKNNSSGNLTGIFSSLLLTAIVFLLTLITSAATLNEKSIKPLAMQIKPQLQSTDEVVTFYKYYQDLPIYLERRIVIVADWDAPDIQDNDNWVRELWYGMAFQDTKDWLIDQKTFWKRWNSNKRLFVLTDENYYDHLKTKAKIYKISQHHDVVLITNKPDFILQTQTSSQQYI